MNPSKRINDRCKKLEHYINSNLVSRQFNSPVHIYDRKIIIHFDYNNEKFENFGFSGDLGQYYDGIFDLYLDLIEGKDISEIKKVDSRVLDHYLRDTPSQKIFEYYPDMFLKIISIPKAISAIIENEKNNKPFFKVNEHGPFLELPLSMQLDLLEDYFAEDKSMDATFLDFDNETLEVKSQMKIEIIEKKLLYNFQVPLKVILK